MYGIARLWREHAQPGELTIQLHQGLFAWDGALDRDIKTPGDAALPEAALRFFPLYPLFGRGLGWMLGGNEGLALLADRQRERVGGRRGADAPSCSSSTSPIDGPPKPSASLLALAPPAFVLVWAYVVALYLVCVIGMLLALRRRSWWWAALARAPRRARSPVRRGARGARRDPGPEGVAARVAVDRVARAGGDRGTHHRSRRRSCSGSGSLDPIHQQGQLRGSGSIRSGA